MMEDRRLLEEATQSGKKTINHLGFAAGLKPSIPWKRILAVCRGMASRMYAVR